mmetsp:Transcript_43974/g.61808  ORF Transcript_43974/g.61808 Transcript_43974/m.61808 type:complete len:90 (-) Transcript_43974:130-399(-)
MIILQYVIPVCYKLICSDNLYHTKKYTRNKILYHRCDCNNRSRHSNPKRVLFAIRMGEKKENRQADLCHFRFRISCAQGYILLSLVFCS